MEKEIISLVVELLLFYKSMFQYDIEVFSQPWLYLWFLFPAIFYFAFFILKWAVLTAPFWVPIRLMIVGIINLDKLKKSG